MSPLLRLLHAAALLLLLAACAPPATPVPTPVATGLPPAAAGERSVPFETVDVWTDSARPTPGFVSPPLVTHLETPDPKANNSQLAKTPSLQLINSQSAVGLLERMLPLETIAALRAVDYDEYFVLVLLRGMQISTGFDSFIERIGYQDGALNVYAQFWGPSPDTPVEAAWVYPYHIVRVRRADLGGDAAGARLNLVLQPYFVTPTPTAP